MSNSMLEKSVRNLIAELGLEKAARKIGVNQITALRIAAGLAVRRGTAALAAMACGLDPEKVK